MLNHVGLFVFLFCASIVNEAFERVASYGLMPNMIFYLMNNYRLEAANGSTILFLWSAMSNGLSIFGAFFSDSFMGRYLVISLGSFCSLLMSHFPLSYSPSFFFVGLASKFLGGIGVLNLDL
jgi:dipeptide/tripeptide permease